MKRSNVGVDELKALVNLPPSYSPPKKLRVAAALLERQRPDLAYAIVRQVADELGAALALSKQTPTAEPPKPNPFEGWTIQPWRAPNSLWASGMGGILLVGAVRHDGWIVWDTVSGAWISEGPETGDEGRGLAEDALIKAGATVPWRAKL